MNKKKLKTNPIHQTQSILISKKKTYCTKRLLITTIFKSFTLNTVTNRFVVQTTFLKFPKIYKKKQLIIYDILSDIIFVFNEIDENTLFHRKSISHVASVKKKL